jgi:2-polyprenyl-3-methyl-5-hydroxy-6-metoxy-1,4-benzoquinol methylase
MVHHSECPLCSSEKIFSKFSCTDYFISKEVFGVFKCDDCSFEFTQDYPEESDIGKFYESEDYISHSDTSKGFSNKIYRLVRNIMLRKKRGIIKSVTGLDKGNILDIGSGTGHFAGTMKEAGWLVKGIEISKKARDFSINHFGLEVIAPEETDTLQGNSFDCITLWHVLEHFHNPFKYFSDITRLLKPGGICLIALPNSGSFDALHYGKYWAAYDVPRHLWHFNPVTFRIFTEKAGFMVEKVRILPADVFYISILSERYRGSRISFISGIIRAFLFSFQAIFRKHKSSSIIYIIRKAID